MPIALTTSLRFHAKIPIALLGLLLLLIDCRGATEPRFATTGVALLSQLSSDHLTIVDLGTDAVSTSPVVVPYNQDAYTQSQDGQHLYISGTSVYSGGTTGGIWSTRLLSFSLAQLSAEWEEPFWDDTGPLLSRFDSLDLRGNSALALTPDQSGILIADASRHGALGIAPADTFGVALLDLRSRDVLDFYSPLRVDINGLVRVPPGAFAPAGAILALGTRTFNPQVPRGAGTLFVFAGAPLAIRDSLHILTPTDSAAGGVRSMILSPDNRYLYFVTQNRHLYKYDLSLRHTVATVSSPRTGPLALSPAGDRLYLADDEGGFDVPRSGMMYVYGGDLGQLGSIDLRSASVSGVPPVVNTLAISRDGSAVYVGAGTPPRGPLFGVQPGQLLVIDAHAEKIAHIIPLGGWGVVHITLR